MAVSTLEVLVTGNSTGLVSALSKAVGSTKAFSSTMSKTGTGALGTLTKLSPAFIALGAAAAIGIGKGIAATQEWAAGVRTLQRVTGDSAEFTSALAGAGKILNLDIQKLNTGFGVFAKNITSANPKLAKYGVITHDATGATLPFNEVLANASDRFLTLAPGIEQTGFAMALFGRSGKEMIPILAKGAEGMQELYDKAKAAGLVMSQEDLDASKELSIAQRELRDSFEGASISIGKDFIPAMTTVTNILTKTVQLFGLIPGPVKKAIFGITALTGALAALQFAGSFFTRTWGKVTGVLASSGIAGGEAAVGTGAAGVAAGASVLPTEALVTAVGELVLVLQSAFPAAAETAGSVGALGLAEGAAVVPTEAETAALVEQQAVMKGGLLSSLGSVGILAGTAAAGLALMGVEAIVLTRDAKAAHEEFESGILKDFAILSAGGPKARDIRVLARAAPVTQNINPETGQQEKATAAILAHNKAIQQAQEGLQQYRTQQDLLKSSSDDLAHGLSDVIGAAVSADTPIIELGNAVDILNTGIEKSGGMFKEFSDITGQSTDSILSDLSTVVNDAKSTPADVAAAYGQALDSMRQANQEWHDSIVDAFGGAGGALDKFADKSNVDLEKATGALDNYTGKIKSFGTDIDAIQDRFGHRADDFVSWATSQGLAQQGLVHSVANASKEDANAFVKSWQGAQDSTDELARSIQKALDPVFHNIIDWLKTVVSAITGVPPVKVKAETAQAQRAVENLHNALDLLPANKRVDILTHIHAGSPWPDEALKMHLFDPLKKNGAKQIGGVWTIPLEVGVHTAINQAAMGKTAEQIAHAIRNTSGGIMRTILQSGATKGEAQGVIDRIMESGFAPNFIEKSSHDILRELGKNAARSYKVHLRQLDRLTEIQHRQEIIAASEAARQAFVLEGNPQLPRGGTHISRRPHGRRGDGVRLDRTRFDEGLAYQRDYSGYNV